MCSRIKLVGIALVCLVSCINNQDNKDHKRKPIPVKTITVCSTNNQSSNTYIGTIRSTKASIVSTLNSGTIKHLYIKQAGSVSKNDTLAIIDSPTVNSSYEIAQSAYKQAEDGLRRAKSVYNSGGIPEVKMIEIQTQYDQALSAYKAAKNALNKCTLLAAFDSYVEELYVEEGQSVDLLQTIAKLVNINNLELDFSVSEKEIGNIAEGQEIRVELPALGVKDIKTKISSKSVSANRLSHTYNCTAAISNKDGNILPGMLCKVKIYEKKEDEIIIPAEVLLTDTKGRYLWIVEDNKAVKRMVEVGGFAPNGIIIKSGLEEGEEIIVEGYQKVSTGMAVSTEIATSLLSSQ